MFGGGLILGISAESDRTKPMTLFVQVLYLLDTCYCRIYHNSLYFLDAFRMSFSCINFEED